MIYREEPPESRPMPACPVCGSGTLSFYVSDHGSVIGCDFCIDIRTICCPVCGAEALEIYKDADGRVVGCRECVRTKDAAAWEEENCADW